MGRPSHGLRTIPARECIRRETRVNKGEVSAIQRMVEVVIVIVHLRRGELALVNDILGRKRAYIEALSESAWIIANRLSLSYSLR